MTGFRLIPSIEQLRRRRAVEELESRYGRAAVVDALREAASQVREEMSRRLLEGADEEAIAERIEGLAAAAVRGELEPSLQPVINATGVIVHTNLGRAPLAASALEAVAAAARGYSTLEYDLARGARGARDAHVEPLLRRLTGADAGLVVNNNAAAVLLVLSALAAGREVIVSRGELVEIGGGFRVPDVMKQSGALLREVGTTNRTRVADYAAAISDRTALILRVHPSNFRISGFCERPPLAELVALAHRFELPMVEDLGSGYLKQAAVAIRPAPGSPPFDEPAVEDSVSAGVDVCCFSGDKLLGGPQAGIIVGRGPLVERIRRHPLMRALRVDKMTCAALHATLSAYAAGQAGSLVPVQRMLALAPEEIKARALALVAELGSRPSAALAVVPGASAIGGGSAPDVELPTWLIAVSKPGLSAAEIEARLRHAAPPVIARIERDNVLLDLRTVLPDQDRELLRILQTV
jgi:L-seryl-tRNA(Ser) seleniumtransferase